MWSATWTPWGSPHTITGAATLDARFPGQWFQLESSLHYNWHRHYDPTLGRYTQPDPLGFVDGPSVFGYVRGLPGMLVDPEGLRVGNAVRVLIEACLVAWQLLTGDKVTTRRPPVPPRPPITRPQPDPKPTPVPPTAGPDRNPGPGPKPKAE